MFVETRVAAAALIASSLALASPAVAAAQSPGSYDDAYLRYLAAARRTGPESRPMWMADLTSDPSARHVNDLVTIRVIESLSASGSADSTVAKSGNASASVPGKVGEWLGKALPVSSETQFNGAGGTTRSTELSATLTARVVEVLPNGDMVVEGVREVDINGDRSVVVLTGVVRPFDIQPGNVVPSALVGQLRIRSLSAGLVKDSLSPGWLIRILNKVF
jgi:flagellar L-ring protein precursor FlgH